MTKKLPKSLLALIIVTASLVSCLAGYILIQSELHPQTADQQRGTILDRFKGLGDGAGSATLPIPDGLFQITNDQTLSATNDIGSDSILYYHADTGVASRVDINTRQSTIISSNILPHLIKTIWSPNKKEVVSVFSSVRGLEYKYFNYDTKRTTVIGRSILDLVFSPDGKKIAFTQGSGDETNIMIANSDGGNANLLLKTRLGDIHLDWPASHTLALTVRTDGGLSDIYTLTDEADITKIFGDVSGLSVKWNSDGSRFIYSQRVDDTTKLNLYNTLTGQTTPLAVVADAGHCTWTLDSRYVFCAAEEHGETAITKIYTNNGSTQTISSGLIISPGELFLSHLEDYLIAVNQSDHSIYGIKVSE